MNGWERWAKRIVKGVIWVASFVAIAWALEIAATWRVMLLVMICNLIDSILNDVLPTAIADDRAEVK